MKFETSRTIAVWISALIACTLPWIVAFDNGAVFPWTKWLTGVLMLFPVAISLWEIHYIETPFSLQKFALIAAAFGLSLLALLQLVPLPMAVTAFLSEGVSDARHQWLQPLVDLGAIEPVSRGTTSVSPESGWAYVSYFSLLAVFLWSGQTLFQNRSRTLALLALFSILGGCHALVGILQVLSTPQETIWGITGANPFGAFINSNNAAGLLLIAIAGCVGILAWRISTLTGYSIGEEGFQLSSLLDMTNDRVAVLTIGGGVVSFFGIIISGSRGGLVAAMCGGVVAFGLLKVQRLVVRISILVGILVICSLTLLVRFEVKPENIDRFGATANGLTESIVSDGRWSHWLNVTMALPHYLPMGSGFGSYKYAYLPYQSEGNEKWFHHADNLWLEWTTEGGVLVLVILTIALVFLLRAIATLRRSHDPMDQGLAAAGAFATVAVFVSQLFDFGLLFIGASGSFCLLAGLLFARANVVDNDLVEPRRKTNIRFSSASFPSYVYSVAVLVCISHVGSIFLTYREAETDAVKRYAEHTDHRNPTALAGAIDRLSNAHPEMHSGDLLYQQARLYLAQAENQIVSSLENLPWYPRFSSSLRGNAVTRHLVLLRLFKHNSVEDPIFYDLAVAEIEQAFGDARVYLQQANDYAIDALRLQPLSPEARFVLLWSELGLDVTSNRPLEIREKICEQLAVLRLGAVNSLDELAEIAALDNQWQLAIECWHQYLIASPEQSYRVMLLAESLEADLPMAVVPQKEACFESIGEKLLLEDSPETSRLQVVFDLLVTQIPREKKQRVRRYRLLGTLADELKNEEKAMEFYQKLVASEPTQFSHHVRFIDYLKKIGRLRQAKEYCLKLAEERPELNNELEPITSSIQEEIDRVNRELMSPIPTLVD